MVHASFNPQQLQAIHRVIEDYNAWCDEKRSLTDQ